MRRSGGGQPGDESAVDVLVGPAVSQSWAERPIATRRIRASMVTADDSDFRQGRVRAGVGAVLRTTDQYELDLTDGGRTPSFACLRSGEARTVVTRGDRNAA
jgi:hypothetical protein